MPRQRRLSPIVALFIVASGLGACNFDLTGLTDLFASHLVSISVSGDSAVVVGDTIRLKATGSLDGLIGILAYDPLGDAKWSSSDPSVATVVRPTPSPDDTLASAVLVRGIRPGRVVIEASARGVAGSKVVVVTRVITRPSASR